MRGYCIHMKLPKQQLKEHQRHVESHTALYDQTRKTLIARLKNWEDQKTWDEFYQIYWRLIYSVGLKAGLNADDAFDIVQDTILAIAKQNAEGRGYDATKGSFKVWLLQITRWRIKDKWRDYQKQPLEHKAEQKEDDPLESYDRVGQLDQAHFDLYWDEEWKQHLLDETLREVKLEVSPQHYQLFAASVFDDLSMAEIKANFGVSASQVYLAKHRVSKVFKKHYKSIQERSE